MVDVLARLVFLALVAAAAIWDVRSRRIPNGLTALLAVLGVLAAALGAIPGHGVLGALGSLALGFVLWIPFYALGMMGAGDVKLFAAAAAWLAAAAVVQAALATAVIGGVLSLIWMLFERGAGFTAVRLAHALRQPNVLRESVPTPEPRRARLPYGVAMALGLLAAAARAWSLV